MRVRILRKTLVVAVSTLMSLVATAHSTAIDGTKVLTETALQGKTEAEAAYKAAMEVYVQCADHYEYCMKALNTLAGEVENDQQPARENADIADALAKKISESGMTDEDKAACLEELEEIAAKAYEMRDVSTKINHMNAAIYARIKEMLDVLGEYYDRLVQYKGRIDSATTADELEKLIAEIKQDTEETELYHQSELSALDAVLNDMILDAERIHEEIPEVKMALSVFSGKVSVIEGKAVYEQCISRNDSCMMIIKSLLGEQEDIYIRIQGMEVFAADLEVKISEASMTDEDKTSCREELSMIYMQLKVLYAESDTIQKYIEQFSAITKAQYDVLNAYRDRLEEYKDRIESAATAEEIEALVAEVERDMEEIKASYEQTIENELMMLAEVLSSLRIEAANVEARLEALVVIVEEAIIAGIEDILCADTDTVVVYTLGGVKQTMKKDDLKSLPSGVYIVNGKKFVVK